MISKYSLLLGGALFAFAVPAAAQPADTQSEAEDQGGADDDVIVVSGKYTLPDAIDTATGLGLTVRETPQSVSIMTAQRILDQNLTSVKDVIVNSVGVSVNSLDDLRNEFFARGFKINNFQFDGVPLAWTLAGGAGETSVDASIYERVEIVRGATGLLSGAGDPSASVNFVRKHADATDLAGYVNAGFGSWDTWRISADVGSALTSDGRIRFRGVGRYEEGKSQVDLYKNKKFVLYGVIDADITESTLLRVGISHQENDRDAPAWGNLPTFYSDGTVTDWPRSKSTTASWAYWDTTNQNIFATLKQDFGEDWSIVVNYNRLKNSEKAKLLYLSGLVDKATGLIQYAYPYKDAGSSVQNSFDAQIKGKVNVFGRDHEVVLGALHSVQKRRNFGYNALSYPASGPDFVNWDGAAYPDPGFSETGSLAVRERVEQNGVYGVVRLNIADPFKLIGGGRISSWKSRGVSYGVSSDFGDSGVFIPYVGALFDITPNHRLYASFTKIFQPQSARDRALKLLDPLDGKAYEIGLKSAFFNEALQTSVALFRVEQDNLAVPDIVVIPPGGGLPQQTYRSAQGTVSKGFEIEITGSPLPGWNVNFGYTQFKAKDAEGNAVNTDQPRKLLKLFTTYTIENLLQGFTFGGGVNYRSKAYSPGSNPVTGDPFRFQQDSYATVSLMARLNVTEQFQLQANVENLFDKKYYSQMGFYSQYRYGAPRNFNIAANYKF